MKQLMLDMADSSRPVSGSSSQMQRQGIEGEPDLLTGSLKDWQAYRQTLGQLPQNDQNVRLAIAVAEAQIAKLRRQK